MRVEGPDKPSAPRIIETWRADLKRGLAALASGSFEVAEAHFQRAYLRAPERPEVCFALGRERLRLGKHAEAEPLLRAAWEHDPGLLAAAAGLARCVSSSEPPRLAEAHAIVDAALERHAADPALLVLRGELYLEESRADDARAVLDQAVVALEAQARDGKALPAARIAAGVALARAWNMTGIALANDDRTEEALFAFKRAADLDRDASGPVVNMGVAFARLGRLARARSCYERALVLEPENATARANLAKMARDAGDPRRAETGYRAVLDVDPEYPGARAALAELLLERADAVGAAGAAGAGNVTRDDDHEDALAEAVELLRAALDESPADAEAWYRLGAAYQAAGEIDEAERHLRGAIAREEDHVGAHCRLAGLLARDGRYLEAATLARRARALDPERAAALLGE